MLRSVFAFGLLSLGLASGPASANCFVGDHNCRFHGQGRAVSDVTSQYGQTGVFIVSTANNGIDFDNQILLPDGHGPYIQSDTGTAPIDDQPYSTGLEQFRNVGSENFQNNFQNGTVQATHSGDFNGGEVHPNPPGCAVSIGNCEEVYIQGNIPDLGNPGGFEVKQTIQLYNHPKVDDPVTTVTSFAAASGKAYIIDTDHVPVAEPDLFAVPQRQELASRISEKHIDELAGTGDIGIEHTYNIGYNDFDIHAGGLVVFPNQIWKQASDPYKVSVEHSWMETPYGNFHAQEGWQHTNYYTQYDYNLDFRNKDPVTGMPVLQQNNDITAQWTTVSGIYGIHATDAAVQYGQIQAKLMQEQADRDQAARCNYSGCSNDVVQNAYDWAGYKTWPQTIAAITPQSGGPLIIPAVTPKYNTEVGLEDTLPLPSGAGSLLTEDGHEMIQGDGILIFDNDLALNHPYKNPLIPSPINQDYYLALGSDIKIFFDNAGNRIQLAQSDPRNFITASEQFRYENSNTGLVGDIKIIGYNSADFISFGAVSKIGEINRISDYHYDRNLYDNTEGNLEYEDVLDSDLYQELSWNQSIFHKIPFVGEQGIEAIFNRKFVSNDGSEYVFDYQNNLISDCINGGSYNFYPPSNAEKHTVYDVAPYFLLGNCK